MTESTSAPASDIWSLTPQQASERLQSMKPAPTPTGWAERKVATLTPGQARIALAELQADEKWTQRFLDGGLKERKQFDELAAKKNEAADGQLVEIAMRHGVEAAPLIPEVTFDGALNTAKLANVIADLRDHGLEDDHISEAFDEERTIDRATHDAVKRLEQQRLGDAEYVKRYLAGGAAEKREMALIRIALGLKIA
jgi:hypothetical protein